MLHRPRGFVSGEKADSVIGVYIHKTICIETYDGLQSIDHLRRLFDYLKQHPIIDIKRTASALNVSYNTIASAVLKLTSLGILHETTNAARNRVFAYREYLNILRKDT